MHVDEAVVISLPHRVERRQRLAQRLASQWPFPRPTIVDGVQEPGPPWFRSSDAAWGCRQAHLRVLGSAWERGVEATLVLEDDAVPSPLLGSAWPDLSQRIPRDWAMVMLGGEHIQDPRPHGAHLVTCTNARRTHAYIVRLRAIPFLMRTWSQARRHIDHSSERFQAVASVYAPTQWLIGQDAGWSDIAARENRDVRFWS